MADAKEEVRERIWALLEREHAARFPGARGRIPNFRGAEQAAAWLAELTEWRSTARGVRIGKGGGFSDLEFALLVEHGLVSDETTIATTVHDLQLLDEDLPETKHDFRVDVIVTPTTTVHTRRRRRPPGIVWDQLDPEKIESIPVLAALGVVDREPGAPDRRLDVWLGWRPPRRRPST